ncbi:MAG: tRNA (N6-threonylcarbamoyladenosine(37)-N6)-methyltransferase TrmO [Akkermansiaceae bacterium]
MNLDIIGRISTCYGEKFGVPRQPGIVKEAWGRLVFEPEFRNADAVRGLEDFSHVWLVFVFHQSIQDGWKPMVRPPRLGGNEKRGVFSTRSPFRPNPIGLSCVKLDSIDFDHADGPLLKLSGVDLVDGTPILDIKPYIPYADSVPEAHGSFAHKAPGMLKVKWDENINQGDLPVELIEATLSADPRPAYQHREAGREYGCLISGYNVRWSVAEQVVFVQSCEKTEKLP